MLLVSMMVKMVVFADVLLLVFRVHGGVVVLLLV